MLHTDKITTWVRRSLTPFLIFLVFSLGTLTLSIQEIDATTTVSWEFLTYTFSDGGIKNPFTPVKFTVEDTDLATDPTLNTIEVLIASTVDPIGTTLKLTESGPITGIFTNTNFIFMETNQIFAVQDTATLIINNFTNADPGVIDVLLAGVEGVEVKSSTDTVGILVDLFETGVDTSIFTRTLRFSTVSSDDATATIKVSPGDVFTIRDEVLSGVLANGLIEPRLDEVGAILAELQGLVTVSYNGESDSALIIAITGPGRSGGGVIHPGLVFDFIGFFGLGCLGDCSPPTLGLDSNSNRLVDEGFSYNGVSVDVEQYYTPFPLITTQVGENNLARLKIFDNLGPENIQHVEIAFGIREGNTLAKSNAIINFDRNFKGEQFTNLFDPENALEKVVINTETGPCAVKSNSNCLILNVYHTFREPLEFNMVATNVWDFYRNAWQNFYNHGIEITGESMNPPEFIQVRDFRGHPIKIMPIDFDTALDEEGNEWKKIDQFWFKESKPVKRLNKPMSMHGIDRNNNMFQVFIDGQILLAQETLSNLVNGKIIQNLDFPR